MNAYNQITPETIQEDMRYLQLLSHSFPTIADASTEIINLEAILNLPKGTEHFLADLHGEYEAFQHVLRNASGAIKRKVNEIFGNTLRENEKKELCTLIYYPEQKLELIKGVETDIDDWYVITLNQLVRVCQNVSSKYTRSKVRKALPKEFSYIIQELLHESSMVPNKQAYINVIISTIISTRRADDFIIALCQLIQRLTIDTLHVLGDIFDRGPAPHRIMDILCNYHNFDVQWGNHDILWMGAAAGNECCMANVLRLAMRYGNLSVLEDGYGINLLPLATFAMETYAEDSCSLFGPKVEGQECTYNEKTLRMIAQMHKAISIIQFKLEAEIIKRRPDFGMDDRMLLHRIDFERNILTLDGKEYELKDSFLPTVDPADPYKLTPEEREIMNKLHHSFVSSEKLKKHMRCLFRYGCMYTVSNSNLLFHASVPLNEDGTFKTAILNTMQTPALFALKNQLLEGEAKAKMIDRLRENFAQHDLCLQTGFLGTSILMATLTENGMEDIAYELLFQRKNPSWLYSVDNGATTIWERWNSYMIDKGMGPRGMNSFNHYAYGCVCEWIWETVAGIAADPATPGFKHIIMKPIPDKRLGHVTAEYHSASGLIKSAWKYEGDTWIWEFTIPKGVTATVTLPGEMKSKEYGSGTYKVTK